MDVYLIPGLGADHRLFAKLDLTGYDVQYLDWPAMPVGSTLNDFASKLAEKIDHTRSHALIGVSMGGMVAQELAAMTKPKKVVIISSWKGAQEMPTHIRLMRGTHPERMLTKAIMERGLPVVRWQMGVRSPEAVALFDELIKVHSLEQMKVQVNACLSWNGPKEPVKDLVHIHGDKDHLMPISAIEGPRMIAGGGHFMVFNKPAEVGKEVMDALAME